MILTYFILNLLLLTGALFALFIRLIHLVRLPFTSKTILHDVQLTASRRIPDGFVPIPATLGYRLYCSPDVMFDCVTVPRKHTFVVLMDSPLLFAPKSAAYVIGDDILFLIDDQGQYYAMPWRFPFFTSAFLMLRLRVLHIIQVTGDKYNNMSIVALM
jgi:hypothetical protein